MLEIRGCYHTRLSDLLVGVGYDSEVDASVSGICLNIDELCPGDVWVCFAPCEDDILRAQKAQAVAVLCAKHPGSDYQIPVIVMHPWHQSIATVLNEFYQSPSTHMHMIGVTGTNGKSSVAYLISRALQSLGKQAGYIGTLGWGRPGQLSPQKLTTPGVVDLYRMLADLRDQSIDYVALEASSHGLDQRRIEQIAIDVAVFTNLTHDHMDYHRTINAYLAAKRKLFEAPSVSTSVINVDDPSGSYLAEQLDTGVWACSLEDYPRAFKKWSYATVHAMGADGQMIKIMTHHAQVTIQSRLIGVFNAYNLMLAHAALCASGVDAASAAKALSTVELIPGRMVPIRYENLRPMVYVDYAHTPDALDKVLSTLKGIAQSKLWVVFGCGGGRDRAKRPKAGQIAERYADMVCITADNSRGEAFESISADILAGMTCPSLAMIYPCRYAAIAYALNTASSKDIVLIAGMGDEKSYIVSSKAYLSDVEIIESLLYE